MPGCAPCPGRAADRPGRGVGRGPRRLVGRPGAAPARDARGRGLRRRAAALHHVHQRHDGEAQGHPAHQRRVPHPCLGHAPAHLRHQARDGRVLDGGRHRLGDRAQLHRLRPAGQRHDLGHVRGHAGHARPRPLVADRREVQGQHPLHRADHHPHLHEVGGGPAGCARPDEPPTPGVGGRAHQSRGLDLVPLPHRRGPLSRSSTPGGRPRPAAS